MSFAVRFGTHPDSGNRAAAVYLSPQAKRSWSWDGMWVWGPDLLWFPWFNIDGLKLFLQLRGMVDKGELEKVKRMAQIRAERVKERANESARNRQAITSKRESGG
jgi:hypothetical protein